MQHLENDMDDLFQRAAENYPLQEGKGDWENIAKRISDNTNSPKVFAPLQNNRNKKFLALAFLLFTLVIGWLMFQNFKTEIHSASIVNKVTKEKRNMSNTPGKNIDQSLAPGKREGYNFDQEKSKGTDYNKNIKKYSINSSPKITTGKSNLSFYSEKYIISLNEEHTGAKDVNESTPGSKVFSTGKNLSEKQEKEVAENSGNVSARIAGQNIEGNKEIKDNLKRNNSPDITEKKKKEIPGIIQKKKGVYIGVVAGPDFSKVRSGSFNNTGFDAGILLGFRLNRNLSFESGLLWNKKNYYSDGKNFSMDKVRSTMPSGMIINNLKSNSSVIEIPLKVRYDFISKNNSDLFVAGGVSSYIITKEKNIYNVTLNGNQEKLGGVYKKNSYGLPAVANVSIGYEHSVSKNLNIRIEPFLKIPLQGMGVGSLPVTSAGLQVGVTGRLK